MQKKFKFEPSDIIMILILLAVLAFFLLVPMGCATVTEQDGQGNIVRHIESKGFLRNAKFKETKPDGTVVELSTESTTSDVLLGLDKLTGTLINGAEKATGAVK